MYRLFVGNLLVQVHTLYFEKALMKDNLVSIAKGIALLKADEIEELSEKVFSNGDKK